MADIAFEEPKEPQRFDYLDEHSKAQAALQNALFTFDNVIYTLETIGMDKLAENLRYIYNEVYIAMDLEESSHGKMFAKFIHAGDEANANMMNGILSTLFENRSK
jgi:hypothetical protein